MSDNKQVPHRPYWLDDSKPAPRCPYCRKEMGLNELFEREKGWVASLICKCGACAPIVIGEKTALSAIEAAYNAAMTCWQEPNRPLTAEEAVAICTADNWELVWLEERKPKLRLNQYCGWFETYISLAFVSPGSNDNVERLKAEYGQRWRCWLREPTVQEMVETPWGENDG